MNEFTPVPYGALRAVFRDPSAATGLMVRPVVGFTAPAPSGSAMVFGGPIPPELYAANVPDPDANAGALGVPVVVTRRGELRTVRTHFPASGPDDVQDAAPASVDLVDGVEPGPAFLGLVQSHEDPAEVFRAHLEAATTHKAAVDTSKAAQVRPELPPRTVPADVVDVAPVANRARRDLDAILDDARALTDTDIEAMGESPEDW